MSVSRVTAGAMKSAAWSSLVSSVTAGPSICAQVIDCTESPGCGAGQARTETLPPMRTDWLTRRVSRAEVVCAPTAMVRS